MELLQQSCLGLCRRWPAEGGIFNKRLLLRRKTLSRDPQVLAARLTRCRPRPLVGAARHQPRFAGRAVYASFCLLDRTFLIFGAMLGHDSVAVACKQP